MNAPTLEMPAAPSAAPDERQVVVLHVHDGDYAIPIARVQEIVRVPAITRVPNAAPGVEGVISLRGRVLPVLDLAVRLGVGQIERKASARVVVVEHGASAIGLLVDGVSEVLRLSHGQIEPPTDVGGDAVRCVEGVAKLGEHLALVLDLDATIA